MAVANRAVPRLREGAQQVDDAVAEGGEGGGDAVLPAPAFPQHALQGGQRGGELRIPPGRVVRVELYHASEQSE